MNQYQNSLSMYLVALSVFSRRFA